MAVIELRKKSQVTIPKEFIEKLSLQEGDKLEAIAKDGVLYLMPVSVYPKKYVEELEKVAADTKDQIKAGLLPVFHNVDDLFKSLDD